MYLPPIVSLLTLPNLSFYLKRKTCFCRSISALWSFLSLELKLSQHLKVSARVGQHKLLILQSTLYYLSLCMLLHWDKKTCLKKVYISTQIQTGHRQYIHTLSYFCNLCTLTVAWNSYFRFNIDHLKSYSHMAFLDNKNWQRSNSEFHTLTSSGWSLSLCPLKPSIEIQKVIFTLKGISADHNNQCGLYCSSLHNLQCTKFRFSTIQVKNKIKILNKTFGLPPRSYHLKLLLQRNHHMSQTLLCMKSF